MKILITGSFGNIGVSTIEDLLKKKEHQVRCLDIKTPVNEKTAAGYAGKIEVIWGDITSANDVKKAVNSVDAIIHLCFIIPSIMSHTGKSSEDNPKWAERINMGGTQNIIDAANAQSKKPKLVFASSISIYGDTQNQPYPRKITDPLRPTDHYTRHKVKCEELVAQSGLQWVILRFAAVLSFTVGANQDMFMIPLNDRVEFVDTRDVGTACANAAINDKAVGKILHVGGGKKCQFHYREIVGRTLEAMGIGMLPEKVFTTKNFYIDWLDTTEAQEILKFQNHSFDDYLNEMIKNLGFKRHLARIFSPLAKLYLLTKSPYYKKAQSV